VTVRILSDFDGVWTDQATEAEHVKAFQHAEAARLAGVDPAEAERDFAAYVAAVLAAPDRFGWTPDGRITAYCDEDPFCHPNSVAGWIEAAAERDVRARCYRDAILGAGFANLTAFANHCFLEATGTYRTAHPPALVPGAGEAFEALHDAGAEVVVVSNSHAEKVVGWLRHAGIDAGEDEGHLVRVHGDAGKWHVGSDEAITVAGRRILVDRPRYRAVIEEEDPDLVVGDVFSLDLALPHVLRSSADPRAPHLLALRRHPHTPDWVLATQADGAIDVVLDHVRDLVVVVRELAAQGGR
jgi:phosphoglycolate phosphatase-like HAD superfamily hydrolase